MGRAFTFGGPTTIVQSPAQLLVEAQGLITETFPRAMAASPSGLAVSGTVYYNGIYLFAGRPISTISVIVTVNGQTVTVSKVGLYDPAGNRLAVSADQGTAWQTTGLKDAALTSPYTPSVSGLYYGAIIGVASTMPGMPRGGLAAGNAISAVAINGGYLPFGSQTGQTDLPVTGVIAPGALPGAIWMGFR